MEFEAYRRGIDLLLQRPDLTIGVRTNLQEINRLLLEKEILGRSAARSLRRKVGEVVSGQSFREPPLPQLLRELGSLTSRRNRPGS